MKESLGNNPSRSELEVLSRLRSIKPRIKELEEKETRTPEESDELRTLSWELDDLNRKLRKFYK